jgi:hypothetical protein
MNLYIFFNIDDKFSCQKINQKIPFLTQWFKMIFNNHFVKFVENFSENLISMSRKVQKIPKFT